MQEGTHSFDLIIIGGGSAGFAAAIKANELGAKTLMINAGLPIGGTCVNVGCVPFAGVGLTEEEQMKKMGTCSCRTLKFSDLPRAIIKERTDGIIKIVAHPKTGQVVGVHILAPDAGELIAQAMLIIKNKMTIFDVIETLPVFPTLSEAIKLCALSFTKDVSKFPCCV